MNYLTWIIIIFFCCGSANAEPNSFIQFGTLKIPFSCNTSCYNDTLGLTVSRPPSATGFLSGEVKFDLNGRSFISFYENGFVKSGTTIIPRIINGKPEFDYFSGTYSQQRDAIWGNTVYSPDKGVYTTYSGAEFEGQFYSTTYVELATANGAYSMLGSSGEFSPSIIINIRKGGELKVRSYNRLNIIFVGTIKYKGRRQTGVFAQRDYSPGGELTLSKSSKETIKHFIQEEDDLRKIVELRLADEKKSEQNRLNRKSSATVPWGKVFAISAGVLMAEKSELDGETKIEFIDSYTKDVLSGGTENLSALKNKYDDNQSAKDMLDAFNQSARDLSSESLKSKLNNNPQPKNNGTTNKIDNLSARPSLNINDSDCTSIRINLDTLASTTDTQLKARYADWQKDYENNCSEQPRNESIKPSYFSQIGRINLEQCEETNEVQVGMFCSNAMAHFYEYRSALAKGGNQLVIDGLYRAHTESAKLYIHALDRLKTLK